MNKLIINADLGVEKISRHLYGHFAEHLGRCVYEGLWVGEDSAIANTHGFRTDVLTALRNLNIPNLRWPGGCFADTYHWMDGIGPRQNRPRIVNVHWGGTVENNHFGTHEFLDLCEQLSTPDHRCEPYIAGNVGSGTVQEMAQWLEYLTMPGESPMADLRRTNGRAEPWDISLWGIGNENWGCGGNMRAEFYADLFRQYGTYCRHFTSGKKLFKIACGFAAEWNETLMRRASKFMNGLSIHYYTLPGTWQQKGSATDFDAQQWRLTIQKAADIERFIHQTASIMDRHDPERRVAIVMDEWGTWYDVEPGTNPGHLYQQNTIRDAVVAGLSLNIFNNQAQRLKIANIAQVANVLQSMVLTDGPRMLLTPTYHVFNLYKVHQDATLLPTHLSADPYLPERAMIGAAGCGDFTSIAAVPQLSASASRDAAGRIHVSICNLHENESATLVCELRGAPIGSVRGMILTASSMAQRNTFDAPHEVQPTEFDRIEKSASAIKLSLPPRSVVILQIDGS